MFSEMLFKCLSAYYFTVIHQFYSNISFVSFSVGMGIEPRAMNTRQVLYK